VDKILRGRRVQEVLRKRRTGKSVPDYPVGTQVWLRLGTRDDKWKPRWKGPYTIVEAPSPFTRRLDGLPLGEYPVVHVQRLQPYYGRSAPAPREIPDVPVEEDTAEEARIEEAVQHTERELGNIYEVEKILEERQTEQGKQFLIKWKNYGIAYSTWEPEENLLHCEDALEEWKQRQKEREQTRKERRERETPESPAHKRRKVRALMRTSSKKLLAAGNC
jgi:hypothetical protein